MKKSRFTEAQIVSILREVDGGTPVTELARKHGVHANTINPFAYSDPSGYYVCDGCTKQQEQVLSDAAKALDKKVLAAMKKYKNDPDEYKALSAFHEDLQKDKGNWHISFGGHTNDPRSPGNTLIRSQGEAGTSDFSISVGGTMIDSREVASHF